MLLEKSKIKNYKLNEKKRKSMREYNYINYDMIKNLKFDEEISCNRYKNYDDGLKDIKLYQLNDKGNILYLVKILDYEILLRDNDEKSFFFNQYYMNEYLEDREKNETIIDYLIKSNFIMLKDEKRIILDYEGINLIKVK